MFAALFSWLAFDLVGPALVVNTAFFMISGFMCTANLKYVSNVHLRPRKYSETLRQLWVQAAIGFDRCMLGAVLVLQSYLELISKIRETVIGFNDIKLVEESEEGTLTNATPMASMLRKYNWMGKVMTVLTAPTRTSARLRGHIMREIMEEFAIGGEARQAATTAAMSHSPELQAFLTNVPPWKESKRDSEGVPAQAVSTTTVAIEDDADDNEDGGDGGDGEAQGGANADVAASDLHLTPVAGPDERAKAAHAALMRQLQSTTYDNIGELSALETQDTAPSKTVDEKINVSPRSLYLSQRTGSSRVVE